MIKPMIPDPPEHFTETSSNLWRSVLKEYELEAHSLELLKAACEALDRANEAREKIAVDGAYFKDRFNQPREHPAVAVERHSRILFARLLRELCLDIEPPADPSRPPGLY